MIRNIAINKINSGRKKYFGFSEKHKITNKTKYIVNNLKIAAIVILISKEIRLFATNNKSARRLALIPKNA